jgi:Ca2+/Na+ antiporter
MSNETYLAFLEIWNYVMVVGAIVLAVAAVLVLIIHKIRSASIKDLKKKYDYLSQNDIKMQMRSIWFFSGAILFALNTVYQPTMEIHYVWFIVRLFITFCVATLIVYISYLLYKYSYPAKLDKKLKELRYTPRISSKGHKMRLLSEEEEDVHLDEGMQAEEDVFSVDYDVWVDEDTGEIKIEKYAGHLEANKCNTCGFYTMKLKQEEIIEPATKNSEGEMIQHWSCSYCGAKRTKPIKIAKLEEGQEFKLPKTLKFKDGKYIDAVKVYVHLSDGSAKEFSFQTAEQAAKFLDQYQEEIDSENALFKG